MDVYTMYMGSDVYTSIRHPEYRDYEKFPYGTFETTLNTTSTANKANSKYYRLAQEKQEQLKKSKAKDNCPFCREQKKRPLGQYLRKRQISNRDDKICEELEEENEEQEDDEQNETSAEQQQHHQHDHHKQHHGHGNVKGGGRNAGDGATQS